MPSHGSLPVLKTTFYRWHVHAENVLGAVLHTKFAFPRLDVDETRPAATRYRLRELCH